jgi:fused signal recognition particle receptor
MFGSNDDKKAPAAAGEKKGLFSWFRKKPQQPVAEQPQTPEPSPRAGSLQPLLPSRCRRSAQPEPAGLLPRSQACAKPVVRRTGQPRCSLPVAAPCRLSLPGRPSRGGLRRSRCACPQAALAPPVRPRAGQQPGCRCRRARGPVVRSPSRHRPSRTRGTCCRPAEQSKPGFFARLKQGLSKTSASIGEGMASLFLGKKVIDDDLLDEIETRLLTADVGVEATSAIVQNLTQKVARKQLADADALYKSLQEELAALLRPVEQPLKIEAQNKPYVILVVGVNGAGKTTTIGKLAKLQLEGKKVMLAAGDTFRAAAVEQLQVWGERNRSR